MAQRRLQKELQTLRREPMDDMVLTPVSDDNLMRWTAHIRGPVDSPFADGVFQLDVQVPPNYPLFPPTVTFVTKVFHPNIHAKVP